MDSTVSPPYAEEKISEKISRRIFRAGRRRRESTGVYLARHEDDELVYAGELKAGFRF
jgi:hypothetical protein